MTSGVANTGVPQRAQEMLLPLLLSPGIFVDVEYEEESFRRVLEDTGSIVNCPVCIADRTERRESQFREGARSRRTVGSLIPS